MQRILVWDIPTRLFHWLLAGAFVGAFGIATLLGDDSGLFPVHMLLGGVMAFMVVLRVIWGFVGSRWARFATFAFGPAAVARYLKDSTGGETRRYAGHNPGASWAIFAMLALSLGLAATGLLMSTGGELVEELHEILAWSMVAVVGVHLAGIAVHTLRHRENIAASIVTGRKLGAPTDAIQGAHALVGVVFLGLTGAWGYGLVRNYDAATNQVRLPVTGQVISLGEGEGGEEEEGEDDDD